MISSRQVLEGLNRKIYDLGKVFNKTGCSTGDVHFCILKMRYAEGFYLKHKDFKMQTRTQSFILGQLMKW